MHFHVACYATVFAAYLKHGATEVRPRAGVPFAGTDHVHGLPAPREQVLRAQPPVVPNRLHMTFLHVVQLHLTKRPRLGKSSTFSMWSTSGRPASGQP